MTGCAWFAAPVLSLAAACRWRAIAVCLLAVSLTACGTTHQASRTVRDLPPLQLEGRTLSVDAVPGLAPTPDLLAVDDAMRRFVDQYTGDVHGARQRLMMLHRAIKGAGTLNLEYDPFADGTAKEVFHRGTANCLSYANLFVALAREAGLNASYQWLEVRPQWTRMGERLAVRLHVNVMVDLAGREHYMIDIDPLPSREIAGSRRISDRDAQALYHNNIAMEALAANDLEQAWVHEVRALQLSPLIPHLWVNLGAVYRLSGQHGEAERSYLYALELDPWDRSAMNNLVVLYGLEGREKDREYWVQRVERYREFNPYYHAWLGDMAGENGEWRQALSHYQHALELLPEDSRLLFATGVIHYHLDELKDASRYIERAIGAADLRSDIETYRAQLRVVEQARTAGL
jgi:Flp pilus assembly protein TadD